MNTNKEVDKLINEVSKMILLYIRKNKDKELTYRSNT